MILNVFLCHPEVDVSYNPILDDCVFQNCTVQIWMILNMLVSHPKVDVLYSQYIWMVICLSKLVMQ